MKSAYANVVLVGAGFSHGFGFPLARELKTVIWSSLSAGGRQGEKIQRALEKRTAWATASFDNIVDDLEALSDIGDETADGLLFALRCSVAFEFWKLMYEMPHEFVTLSLKFHSFDDLFPAILTLNWDGLLELLLSRSNNAHQVVFGATSNAEERTLLQLHAVSTGS